MSEFIEVSIKLRRLCNQSSCTECPIGKAKGKLDTCFEYLTEHPDVVEEIVMKGGADE